jgi:hypothetical protein
VAAADNWFERLQPTPAQDLVRPVQPRLLHAEDRAVAGADRGVGHVEPGVPHAPVLDPGQLLGFVPDRLAFAGLLEHGEHVLGHLREGLEEGRGEDALLLAGHRRDGGLVEDQEVLRPEAERNAEPRRHRQLRDRPLRLRPFADRAERRARPVDPARHPRDLTVRAEGAPDRLGLIIGHRERQAGHHVDDLRADRVQRHDQIRRAPLDHCTRHRRLLGRVLALHDHDTARGAQSSRTAGPVVAHPGQHDTQCCGADAVRDRRQQRIQRAVHHHVLARSYRAGAIGQDFEHGPRSRDRHLSRLDPAAVARPLDRERNSPSEDLDQRATRAPEVLGDDHRRREVQRQGAQHRRQRLETAR